MIAYRQQTKQGQEKTADKIYIIPPDGGEPLKTLTIPLTATGFPHWTPDGRAIAFIDTRNNSANIWTVSLDGKGEAKPLTDFKTESIQLSFAWSPDGKQLAVIRGTRITDAVLISETK
jgi:Tol biopolymer transport system component